MSIQAGVASHIITPYVGLGMEGNAREEGSRGVHDDLHARALVLSNDAGGALAIITLEICMATRPIVEQIRSLVAAQTPLTPEQILVAAIHNHAGPTTIGIFGDAVDAEYLSVVAKTAAGTAVQAWNSRVPARVGYGYGHAEEPVNNRRLQTRDGDTHMNWEGLDPADVLRVFGPVDPQIGLLRVDTAEGEPLATVFNYALHPAILAGDNWLYSADWPGYAIRAIEELHGGMAMFVNGGTGNVNHINFRRPNQKRGYYEARRLGTIVGAAALQALLRIEDLEDDVALGSASQLLTVPGRQVSPEQLAAAQEILAKAQGPLLQAQTDGAPDALFASETVKIAGRWPFSEQLEVQALRLGRLAILTIPGEIFVEYQLDYKRRSPLPYSFLVGYANDYQGYIPTPEAFAQGGYEPTPMSWSKLAPEAGETLINTGLDLLGRLTR